MTTWLTGGPVVRCGGSSIVESTVIPRVLTRVAPRALADGFALWEEREGAEGADDD
jgi:hypothetical protein